MVIDTNIFIEFLRAKDKRATTLFSMANQERLFLSSVTLYELYMGATDEQKKADVNKLTNELSVLPFNADVAKVAASIYLELRKANQIIEFRDIFIAATCIVYNMPLKTLNNKHFERIKNLKLA